MLTGDELLSQRADSSLLWPVILCPPPVACTREEAVTARDCVAVESLLLLQVNTGPRPFENTNAVFPVGGEMYSLL